MTAFSNVADAAFWTEGPHIRAELLEAWLALTIG